MPLAVLGCGLCEEKESTPGPPRKSEPGPHLKEL